MNQRLFQNWLKEKEEKEKKKKKKKENKQNSRIARNSRDQKLYLQSKVSSAFSLPFWVYSMYLSANCQRTEQPEEIAWQMSTYAIETKELVSKELKKGGKELNAGTGFYGT